MFHPHLHPLPDRERKKGKPCPACTNSIKEIDDETRVVFTKGFPQVVGLEYEASCLGPVAQASGAVLEIGFGTGVNLPYYPGAIRSVMAIDPNPGMIPFARSYSPNGKPLVKWSIASAEQLPFPNNGFDTVVSTLTLCSIPQISLAIQELYRVLKPGGRFLFLEHGQSPDRSVRWWQDRLTP